MPYKQVSGHLVRRSFGTDRWSFLGTWTVLDQRRLSSGRAVQAGIQTVTFPPGHSWVSECDNQSALTENGPLREAIIVLRPVPSFVCPYLSYARAFKTSRLKNMFVCPRSLSLVVNWALKINNLSSDISLLYLFRVLFSMTCGGSNTVSSKTAWHIWKLENKSENYTVWSFFPSRLSAVRAKETIRRHYWLNDFRLFTTFNIFSLVRLWSTKADILI